MIVIWRKVRDWPAIRLTGLLPIILLNMACQGLSPDLNSKESDPGSSISVLGSFGKVDQASGATRNTTRVDEGLGLAGRNLLIDPILRPFSTVSALFSLTGKSIGGLTERTFIERVRMPLLERGPIPPVGDLPPMDMALWEQDLDQLVKMEPSYGRVRYLIDGDEFFPRITDAIRHAEKSINMQSYIFDNDDFALEIANLLRMKSETTEVKVLADGLGAYFASRLDSESMPDDVILPSSMAGYLTYDSKVSYRRHSNPWLTGDHSKVTLIDDKTAFVGGMNIGREYRYDWHDLMMEIEGPVVKQLQHEFDLAWAHAGFGGDFAWMLRALSGYERNKSADGHPIRVITTSIHDSELYRVQLEAIRRAQSYIYIENAYFSDDKILFELARARRRGVDVRVILPVSNDSNILQLSNQKSINVMLRNGIRVFAYPGMTHVKAAVFDGWACLGSANFDKLSLQINREINLGFSDPEAVQRLLSRVFWPDFIASTELSDPIPIQVRHHFAEFIADEFF